MNVAILTEAGHTYGYGHFYRCVAISQALKERGVDSKFFVRSGGVGLNDWLTMPLSTNILKFDVILIDSYSTDLLFHRTLGRLHSSIIVLDDNDRLPYYNSLVVNGGLYAKRLPYRNGNYNTYLLGSMYTPLRKAFWNISEKRKIRKTIRKVMINIGGLHTLKWELQIASVLSKAYPQYTYTMVGAMKNKLDDYGMLTLMRSADIAISGAGQKLHELIRVGLPTIALGIAENQNNNIIYAKRKGLIRFSGWQSEQDLFSNVEREFALLTAYDARVKMHQRMMRILDGQGARRIAEGIVIYYERTRSHE